ncbi:MAG TPA: hypothetical protein VFU21_07860 [Kofleriaceae bacterium]|nr:hypothetical protein [Kofleriaceae bacterium]
MGSYGDYLAQRAAPAPATPPATGSGFGMGMMQLVQQLTQQAMQAKAQAAAPKQSVPPDRAVPMAGGAGPEDKAAMLAQGAQQAAAAPSPITLQLPVQAVPQPAPAMPPAAPGGAPGGDDPEAYALGQLLARMLRGR